MFTTKVFIKKNKIGNFLKNVREHYLRDDLFCGLSKCETCSPGDITLSFRINNENNLFNFKHFLILDTNVILDQMDILEEDAICNVIILHTVLKEVRHRSFPIYKRLNAIIENPSRHFFIFTNDHHKDCYLPQDETELVNDYNDRCIRAACLWYMKHAPYAKFVFLTDDIRCRNLAEQEKILTCSVEEYVKNLKEGNLLQDKLARKDYHVEAESEDLFPAHLSKVEIQNGIREGKFRQGTYRASTSNFLEGFVSVDDYDDPILVQGRAGQNRSIDGDLVAVEIFNEQEWVAPSEVILEDESTVDTAVEEVLEKENKLKDNSDKKKDKAKPTGRVVGIIRRKWRQYCGILQQDASEGSLYHLFLPADRRLPKIRIETRQAEFLRTQKIVVAIDDWPRHSRYPAGHFVRALGKIGDQETENEVVLLEHDVPHSKFSEEVLSCLPKLPWIITDEDVAKRTDLRHLDICSVDPPGCTDIDDALHCRDMGDGTLEVGVHIADVSHFIRPGTAIDKEAASRATTVYLVNKRIDMVPELLSSNLCSLRGGEERFAFSCVWKMDANANILATKFHKSIIRSRKAMTYEEAQMIIDDKSRSDTIANSLRNLNKLAKILKQRRLEKGALVLASPEVKIRMDSETMDPIDVEVKQLFETNSMVEEFMLLANISTAQKTLEDFPDCAMLRRHPEPPLGNFEPLVKAGRHLGFEIKTSSNKELAISLDSAIKSDNPYMNTMLRILATRCMMQAVYFASGMFQKEDYYHYGLAVPLYTHFTSPIRRYADIIVHRLLAVSIGADSTYPDLLDKHKTNDLCQNLNYRNRMAQYAGRASVAFNTHLFFRGKLQDEHGYILCVRKNALQILIPKYGLESTLFLSQKDQKSLFEYDEENQTQKYGNIVLHAFDPVVVRLALDSNNIQHEKFVLHLVSPFVEGFSIPPLDDEMKRKSTDPQKVTTSKKHRKK